jgi:hypothetical protein
MLNSMLKIFVGPVMGGGGLNPHQPPREYATGKGRPYWRPQKFDDPFGKPTSVDLLFLGDRPTLPTWRPFFTHFLQYSHP